MSDSDQKNDSDPSDTARNPAPKRPRACITLGMPQTEVARRQRVLEEKFEKAKYAAVREEAISEEVVSRARLAQDGTDSLILGNARWQAYLSEDLAEVAHKSRKAANQEKVLVEHESCRETQRLHQLWVEERKTLQMERVKLQKQVEELESAKAMELKKRESAEEEVNLIKNRQERSAVETERAQQVPSSGQRRGEDG